VAAAATDSLRLWLELGVTGLAIGVSPLHLGLLLLLLFGPQPLRRGSFLWASGQ
jgi:hypothetical protein